MQDRRDLEQRVGELEAEVARLRGRGLRGIRKRASWDLFGLPAYDIALGPDPEKGEFRGHAKGFLAIGDMATGVFALGGLSRGLFAFGGLALGGVAFGGGAVGGVAVGGGAVGVYAMGGGAVGRHVVSAERRDPEALAFFARFGIHPPQMRRR